MFITAVCFLFLIKLGWPKNKSIYKTDTTYNTPNDTLYYLLYNTSLKYNLFSGGSRGGAQKGGGAPLFWVKKRRNDRREKSQQSK